MKKILFAIIILVILLAIVVVFNSREEKTKMNTDESWRNVCKVENPDDAYLDKYIPADFYEKISAGEFSRRLFPEFSDRKAWEKARRSKYADMIIAKADEALKAPVPQILFSHYRRYVIDGNRAEFQKLYFDRRNNLGYLALALCLTGNKEKYMSKVIDYAVAVMEEFTWTLHAHLRWNNGILINYSRTDLFCSETGAMMALLYHTLGSELDKEFENLSEHIRILTLSRTVYNVMYNPESAALHEWYVVKEPNNWTPWCSYNNLTAAILLEKDNERLALYVRQFLRTNARFAARYNDDGYCNEGANYYNEAGMMLFNILHLMHKIRPGSMDRIFEIPKIRAMFEFILHMRIGKKYQVSFGDARPEFSPVIDRVAICGKLINSEMLANISNFKTAALRSNGDSLDTGLKLLFDMPEIKDTEGDYELPFSYFKDRLAVVRSDKFSVTLKVGNNAESHNHNDLGNFTLYCDGEPVIVDAGTETYKKINFTSKRYTLWYTRGSGHNAPVFGGIEQMPGSEYISTFIRADKNVLSADLGSAYPAEAGVKKFIRTIEFEPEKVVVEDKFELAEPREAVITLLSPCKVEKINGRIRIGKVFLDTVGIEFFEQQEMPELFYGKSIWGGPLNAIRFKSKNNNYKFIFKKD